MTKYWSNNVSFTFFKSFKVVCLSVCLSTISSQNRSLLQSKDKLTEQSKASQAVEINIAEPFQPANFNFPKKHCGKQNRAFQSKWLSEFPWLHYNEQSVYVSCFICMLNQIFELPEVRKSDLFLKGFQTGKRRWPDSRSIKCLNAIDYKTNLYRTCRNVWKMPSDAAKKTKNSGV